MLYITYHNSLFCLSVTGRLIRHCFVFTFDASKHIIRLPTIVAILNPARLLGFESFLCCSRGIHTILFESIKLTSKAASSSLLQISFSISCVALLQLKLGLAANAVALNKAQASFITKFYLCHLLSCVLMPKKYGISGGDGSGVTADGVFFTNLQGIIDALDTLAGAHELQDITGPYVVYVEACMSTVHRVKPGAIRARWLI